MKHVFASKLAAGLSAGKSHIVHTCRRAVGSHRPAAPDLDVLIAYDDLNAGKHAKDLCDRLGQQLNPGCKLNIRLWRLSVLKIPEMMEAAAREAARAALIIVAASGKENLPSPVKTWMGMVIGAKHGAGGALVAQFHGIARTFKKLAPAYAYLKRIAHGAGMDFFSEVIEPIDDGIACSIAAIQKRACTRTAVLDAILQQIRSGTRQSIRSADLQ